MKYFAAACLLIASCATTRARPRYWIEAHVRTDGELSEASVHETLVAGALQVFACLDDKRPPEMRAAVALHPDGSVKQADVWMLLGSDVGAKCVGDELASLRFEPGKAERSFAWNVVFHDGPRDHDAPPQIYDEQNTRIYDEEDRLSAKQRGDP